VGRGIGVSPVTLVSFDIDGMLVRQEIAVDFTVLKHRLADVVAHGPSSLTLFAGPPGCRPA
jgi:hypothetical protein